MPLPKTSGLKIKFFVSFKHLIKEYVLVNQIAEGRMNETGINFCLIGLLTIMALKERAAPNTPEK